MQILTKDFIEFIECCVAREVKFLIVGGYALEAHGHPRATKDLDVWIGPMLSDWSSRSLTSGWNQWVWNRPTSSNPTSLYSSATHRRVSI